MSFKISNLLDQLKGRSIYIWGARMTGLGFNRFLKYHHLACKSFIDSDKAFEGKSINGIPVLSPSVVSQLDANAVIVIAVSIKESEIRSAIEASQFLGKVINYSDYCDNFFTIDVMGSCNLKCQSCPHSIEDHGVPGGRMSFAVFEKVIDKILEESELFTHVSLYSWGEPFLNTELPAMVKYLHSKGVAAALSSNLSLPNTNILRDTIKQSPEYLKVSLSGYYPEVYSSTHNGGDINLVKSNMYLLRYFLDTYKASTVVDVNYHLYKNNCGTDYIEMQRLCEELGFNLSSTYALVMPLERVIDFCESKPSNDTIELEKNLLVTIQEGIDASNEQPLETCPFLYNQTNISWDLSVPICCTVFEREGKLLSSNFLHESVASINAKKNINNDTCSKCMSYGLPAYNMGFNQKKWNIIASSKKQNNG